MRPSRDATVEPARRPADGSTAARQLLRQLLRQLRTPLVGAVTVIGVLSLVATACRGADARVVSSVRAQPVDDSPSNPSTNADPSVIVNALDRAGLALCHSDNNDLAQYNIFGLLGAYSTRRYFPHHPAVPINLDRKGGPSCLSPGEPNTGAIEIDVYPSPAAASTALRQVGQLWLAAWLYGNVAVVADHAVPASVVQQAGQALDRVPGASRFG